MFAPMKAHDVVGPVVRLQLDFRKVAIAIVLHELLQLLDLGEDRCSRRCSCVAPRGFPPAALKFRIGLPCKIQTAPTSRRRAILCAIEPPKLRAVRAEFATRHDVRARLID